MTRKIRQVPGVLGAFALLALLTMSATVWAAQEPVTPEDMYAVAVKQLDKGNYERAVELFERVKLRYPLSQYAVLSELRIGDSHFKRGEYPEAIDAYQGFIKAHPRHPELDYVVYRIALSEFKQAPSVAQRDQTPTWRMLRTINGSQGEGVLPFEERFQDSQYKDEVTKMREEGRERLARGVFGIGQYYYRRGRYMWDPLARARSCKAAEERFEQVLALYPDMEELGAMSLYHIGLCETRQAQKSQAQETLGRLKTRFPDSRYIGKLEKRIHKIKKERAPVDVDPRPEAGAPEAGAPEPGAPEAGAPEAGTPDAGAPEAGTPEAGAPDAGAPEAGAPDAGAPEAGTPEAGTPDAVAPEPE